MRRYISYLILTGLALLGVGLASAPLIVSANTDLAYSEGKTLYFRASEYNEASVNGNYEDFLTDAQPVDNDGQPYVVNKIADIMRGRLDNWGLSEYNVEVEGYDTIAVSLRTKSDTSIQYEYLSSYLAFSGQQYELDASMESVSSAAHKPSWETMISGQTAEIYDVEYNGYNFPNVRIPIKKEGENVADFKELLSQCLDHTNDENTETGQSAQVCYLVMWANRLEGELFSDSTRGGGNNANLDKKILFAQDCRNQSCVYYEDNDEEHETPYLRIIPQSKAYTDGQYNPAYAQEAYEAAVYTANLVNASAMEVDGIRYVVHYLYTEDCPLTVESLVNRSFNLNPAWSKTLIAVLVSFAAIALVMALFHRILALSMASSVAITSFATLGVFIAFSTQFNVAALLGLGIAAILALFGSSVYVHALKDEIYKGRTLKKANAEAAKRSTWPIIDGSVVVAILGIFVYIFAGDIVSKLGVMMVIGAAMALLTNLIFTRIAMWLLCNDSTMQGEFAKHINVRSERIPNLLMEEKQTYFGPYEKKDFTKPKFITLGIAAALILAGIGTMIGFGVANGGDFYNDQAAKSPSTILRIDVRSDRSDSISVLGLRDIDSVFDDDGATNHADILHNITIDGKTLASMTDLDGITLTDSSQTKSVYDADEERTYYWHYYKIALHQYLDVNASHAIQVYDEATGTFVDSGETDLTPAIQNYIVDTRVGADNETVSAYFASVVPEVGAPYFYQLALSLGVGLAVAMVYEMIRFRLSRGFALTLVAASTGYIAVAFFVITRLPVTPIFAIGAIAASAFVSLLGLLLLNHEKEIRKQSREKDKNSLEFRSQCLSSALPQIAGEILLLALSCGYLSLLHFGISPSGSYSFIYLTVLIGTLVGVALVLTLEVPMSLLFAKGLSKIHFRLPKPKKKKAKGGQLGKKRSAEPEEAIFIGIND